MLQQRVTVCVWLYLLFSLPTGLRYMHLSELSERRPQTQSQVDVPSTFSRKETLTLSLVLFDEAPATYQIGYH